VYSYLLAVPYRQAMVSTSVEMKHAAFIYELYHYNTAPMLQCCDWLISSKEQGNVAAANFLFPNIPLAVGVLKHCKLNDCGHCKEMSSCLCSKHGGRLQPEGNRSLGRPRRRCWALREIWWAGLGWAGLRIETGWRLLQRRQWNYGEILEWWATASFSVELDS
jgi:hypothetical protein